MEEAENGKAGLERILAYPEGYCAVLLDVVMPEMDGLEVLRRLREEELLEKDPGVPDHGRASDATMKEAYRLGVMDVISKPVVPYVVLRRVKLRGGVVPGAETAGLMWWSVSSQTAGPSTEDHRLNQGMIESLAAAIEFRNGESGQHVRRIHDITMSMLTDTDLGAGLREEIQQIAQASIMHDVGKIAIPDAILNKPGRLTPEEFEIMKTHTTQGSFLLEKIPQLRENGAYQFACDIARHHHERWDGRGYPDGLKR